MVWTPDTLLAHLTQRVDDLEKLFLQKVSDLERLLEQGKSSAKTAVEAALSAQKQLVADAFAASKEAGNKAELLTRERIEAHNEHQARTDQLTHTFATKDWVGSELAALQKEVRNLESRLQTWEDRGGGMTVGVKVLISAVGCLATLVGLIGGLIGIYSLLR